MKIRVLVVDDSGFFRRRVQEMLNSDPRLEVVDTAENGQVAVEKAASVKPDVITMDIEMPVMDGITAVREIMSKSPIPVLMFSSLTTDGAKPTLDALDAGAMDFLPKRFEDISQDREEAKRLLCDKVFQIGSSRGSARRSTTTPVSQSGGAAVRKPAPVQIAPQRSGKIQLVAIGTSTGGPVALQEVLKVLPENFPTPILLIQHMPATFTPAFASRLDQLCQITVKHAEDGDVLCPGTAYLAPGGKQMTLEKDRSGKVAIRVKESAETETYRPCIDLTFSSVADVYPDSTLAIVLTGMGADGREGAKKLNAKGSPIWAQDEASSVVYGMPAAVADAGIAEKILALQDVGASIVRRV